MATHLNIVVVEDNDDLRSLLCAGLQNAGHRVTGLSCAEELEDQLGVDHVDAFLIDINLPGEDGLSLARRVRRAHPLVGIIILSARSALDEKLQGYDDGADIYLTKPVALPELFAALRSFARRRSATLSHMPSDATVQVRGFKLVGNTLLSTEQLLNALIPFTDRVMSLAQLNDAADGVTTTYREAGWTVRAFLPQQEIKDGIVTIQIIEAIFGGVSLQGAEPQRIEAARLVRMAQSQLEIGQPLNARRLDRVLLLLDDLPGVGVSGHLV